MVLVGAISLLLVTSALTGCKEDSGGGQASTTAPLTPPDTTADGKMMELGIDETNEIIDPAVVVFGPESFKSTGFLLSRTEKSFDLGDLPAGRYRLKMQNGNYGPFLYKQCENITITEQKRQCQFDNIVEQVDRQLGRIDKANGYINSKRVFYGKTVTKSQAYFDEPVSLLAGQNSLIVDAQGFPDAKVSVLIQQFENQQNPPTALYSLSRMSGPIPLSVTFNGVYSFDPDGQALTYEWNFGDGSTATGQKVTHAFAAVGNYPVKLKVTDPDGLSQEFTSTIVAKAKTPVNPNANKKPVINAKTMTPDAFNLKKIRVSTEGSYDPDGVIQKYEIGFGDGTKVIASEAEHLYASEGTYLITVKATDDDGGVSSKELSLAIKPDNELQVTETTFGPKTYTGSFKAEDKFTETLTVPAAGPAQSDLYLLTLKNGDGADHPVQKCVGTTVQKLACQYQNTLSQAYIKLMRADWAYIYLNGKRLNPIGSISKKNYLFQTVVKLNGTNKLDLRLRGYPTAAVKLTLEHLVVVADTTAPVIATNLISDQVTNQTEIDVTVTDSSAAHTEIFTHQAVTYATDEKHFRAPLQQGYNNFEIRSRDSHQNAANPLVISNLYVDSVPPELSISVPSSFYTNTLPASFSFQVSANEALSSGDAQGVSLISQSDGSLQGTLQVQSEGTFGFEVRAFDIAGNSSTEDGETQVILDQVAPTVALQVVPMTVYGGAAITVPVVISDTSPTLAKIKVNGVELFQTSAKIFDAPLTLSQEGPNTVQVSVTDAAGNSAPVAAAVLVRDTTPPGLSDLKPLSGSSLRSVVFTASGKSNEALSAVTVNGLELTLTSDGKSFSGQYVSQTQGTTTLHWVATDLVGNTTSTDTQIQLDDTLLNPALVTVMPSADGQHLLIRGAASAARSGTTASAETGFLSFNRASGDVKADGSFCLKMDPFTTARLTITDAGRGQSVSINIDYSSATSLAGVVKDTNAVPLPNVKVSLEGYDTAVYTDGQGAFVYPNAKSGDGKLILDGSTVPQSVTGDTRKFSKVFISVNVGLGQQNVLPQPVYLAPLIVDGTETQVMAQQAATVTQPDVPDFELSIPANAASFPDGRHEGVINVSLIPSDRTTIPVPGAATPSEVVTLEPSGLQFSQRVDLTLANSSELPAGVEMIVLSMNSTKGIWEVDGFAKVSDDGRTIKTKPGLGISHFSLVYAVPVSPVLAEVKAPQKIGINASEGSFSTAISLPSYKSLGQKMGPSLVYRSAWAKPTALVANIFDIPKQEVVVNTSTNDTLVRIDTPSVQKCGLHGLKYECFDDYAYFYIATQTSINTTSSSWYQPESIRSQFFVSSIASDQVSYSNQPPSSTNTISGVTFTNGLQSQAVSYAGIPNKSLMTYAVDLKDPSTDQYLSSGIYPTLARYEVTLRNMRMTSTTGQSITTVNGELNQNVSLNKTTYESTVLDQILPSDLHSNLIIQNKVNSAYGRGWHLGVEQRILNPESSTPIIEEPTGDTSTYGLSNTISTLFDGNLAQNSSLDLANGVDLSQWPTAVIASIENPTVSNIYRANLSNGSDAAYFGVLPRPDGVIEDTSIYNCTNVVSGFFTTYWYPYRQREKIHGMITAPNGDVYGTDAREHSLFRISPNGNYLKLGGALNYVDNENSSHRTVYGFSLNPTQMSSLCQEAFGGECGAPQIRNTYSCQVFGPSCNAGAACAFPGASVSPTTSKVGWARFAGDGTGTVGIDPAAISFNSPRNIIIAPDGKLTLSDTGNNRVRQVDLATNNILTIVGNGANLDTGDEGPAWQSSLFHPRGLAYDSQGNLYVSTENGYIRKVDTNGIIHAFGGKPLGQGGALSNEAHVSNMAFNQPSDMIYDASKNALYMSDTGNNRVVRIDLSTEIATTIAGNGTCDPNNPGDNGSGQLASLCAPTSLGLDSAKNLLILDTGHRRIRRVIFSLVQGGALAFEPSVKDLSKLTKNSDGTWTRTYRSGDVVTFDANGLQTRAQDSAGRQVNYTHDSNGLLTQMTDAANLVTTFNYGGGKLNSITDPAGKTTSFSYSGGLLTSVNFPDGTAKSYDYTAGGLLTKEKDQQNRETTYGYNNWNRVVSVTYPDSTTNQLTDSYSTVANEAASGTANLNPMGTAQGQINSAIRDAKSSETLFSKDINGYVTKVKDALGQQTEIQRDYDGNPIKMVRPDNTSVEFTYDPVTKDRLTTKDVATGITETKTFNNKGQVTTETDGRGFLTKYFYYSNGLLQSVLNPNGTSTSYTYNAKGLPITVTRMLDANTSVTTTNDYDTKGNLIRQVSADGKETQFQYDLAGNQTAVTTTVSTGVTKTTLYGYDVMNRLTQVTEPNGGITQYEYFPTGELKQITDPKGNIATYNYNTRGKLLSRTGFDGKTVSLTYDSNQNVLTQTDPNGGVRSYTYDALDRIITTQMPDDQILMSYSSRGDVQSISNKNSVISNVYDTKQRLVYTKSQGAGAMADYPVIEIANTFDEDGNRTEMDSNLGVMTASFDDMNRLTAMTDWTGATHGFSYDALNRLTQVQRPGSVSGFTYSPAGILQSIVHSNGSNTIDYVNYGYNLRNEITTRQSASISAGYGYDGNGQLTAVTGTHPETFTYDSLGNQTQNNLGSFTYDSASQKLTEDWQYVYTYDNNGNMISKVNKDQNKPAFTYSYSSQNQLIRIQMTSSALGPVVKDISYNYDALGRRMEKRVVDSINPQNSKVRRFVYDGDNIIAEYDASNLLASYIHSPLRADDVLSVAVTSDGVNAGISSSAGNFYYLKDHLGSVTDVVTGSGTRVQRYEYSAFGKILAIRDSSGSDITSSPILKTSYTFTGREWDDEAGLYYYRARYYDPMLGRFLQKDPDPGRIAKPITILNSYTYVGNMPTRSTDPSGKFFDSISNIGKIIGDIGRSVTNAIGSSDLGRAINFLASGTTFGGIAMTIVGDATKQLGDSLYPAERKYLADEPYKFISRQVQDPAIRGALNIFMNYNTISLEGSYIVISELAFLVNPDPATALSAAVALGSTGDFVDRVGSFIQRPADDRWQDRTLLDNYLNGSSIVNIIF